MHGFLAMVLSRPGLRSPCNWRGRARYPSRQLHTYQFHAKWMDGSAYRHQNMSTISGAKWYSHRPTCQLSPHCWISKVVRGHASTRLWGLVGQPSTLWKIFSNFIGNYKYPFFLKGTKHAILFSLSLKVILDHFCSAKPPNGAWLIQLQGHLDGVAGDRFSWHINDGRWCKVCDPKSHSGSSSRKKRIYHWSA